MEYYLEIKQNGLSLEIINHKELYEFSGNIPIKISKDPTYKDWGLVPYIVHNSLPELNSVVCKNGYPLKYNDETGEVILPPEAFEKSGYLFISVSVTDLSNDFHTILYTGTVRIEIPRSIRGNKILNNQSTWEDAVLSYVDTFMKNNYVPLYDELIQRASDLLNDSVTLHETVTIQQDEINNAIDEFNNIKQEVIDIKEIVATQQQNISNAINEYNEMSQDLEEKLTNGYFDGKTILYGEGVPQNDLGDVGDVYINTLNIGEHPYGLFIKEEAGWEYGWKTQGADGTDTLPILGTMFLPQEEEVPLGYEEVTEDGYFIPSNFIGSNEEDKLLNQKLDDLDREIDIMQTQGVAVGDTLPLGSVFYFEGNEEELPTGFEKVEYPIQPKQLLINNDLLINQRGQSEYTSKGYSLDMWLLAGDPFNGSLKINDNGTITITNKSTAYMYFLQKTNLQGKYIAVVKVMNKSGNCTQYFGGTSLSKELNVGVNAFGINQNFTEVGIRLPTNSSITLEYIDLFEGDIVYPHVKEDESLALIKCQRSVIPLSNTIFGYIGLNGSRLYSYCQELKNMKSTPMVINYSKITLKIDGVSQSVNILNASANVETGEISYEIDPISKTNVTISGFVDSTILLSCEPLQ